MKVASRRWPFHVFYSVIDIAIINNWIAYKHLCQSKISRRDYILRVVEEVTENVPMGSQQHLAANTCCPRIKNVTPAAKQGHILHAALERSETETLKSAKAARGQSVENGHQKIVNCAPHKSKNSTPLRLLTLLLKCVWSCLLLQLFFSCLFRDCRFFENPLVLA